MLKYSDTLVSFSEVPDEIALCVNITGCPNHCPGCHSPWLQEDAGKPLDWGSLNALVYINTGITCVAFMGGDSDPGEVSRLAYKTKRLGLKTCWYSGMTEVSHDASLSDFNYIKTGPYVKELGPLTSKTTNQRFWKVTDNRLEDITPVFWK